MNSIIVEGLKYKYPLSSMLTLDNISFQISAGEFVSIIGANGAGKSTLVQALVGLVPHFYGGAYGGKVMIDGIEVKNSELSDLSLKIGIVFQNPFNQITGSRLTVYEEIAFGLENMGIERSEMRKRIDYALQLLDIYQFKERNPFDLSGGQMQRLAIASILAMEPEIIVLDEPTSQLDPGGSEEVYSAIRNLNKNNITVIMVDHKMEKVARYSDRIMLLSSGRLIDFDIPAKIFSREDLQDFGIMPPIYTSLGKALSIRNKVTGYYPVTLEEIYNGMVKTNE